MSAAVEPDRILSELSKLWVSLGKETGGEPDRAVLKACAMTLVVVSDANEDAAGAGETLALLMRDHPSRTIAVRVEPSGEAALEARVVAQCWKPFGSRRQICCEQVEIQTNDSGLAALPSVILPLAVADLPLIVLCRAPGLIESPGLDELSGMATRTVIDSASIADPRAAVRRVAEWALGRIFGDLAWTRLTRWRELIAQIFENPDYLAKLPSVRSVRIVHGGAELPVSGWYLAAWVKLCLRSAGADPSIEFERCKESLVAGLNRLDIRSGDGGLEVSVRKIDGAAEVRVNQLVNRTVFPAPSDYALLREELAITGSDAVFDAVLAEAARLCA
ncbi:MAG: glucose-6-phosphate dehydrogenase assembly protein OpcA [Bryobacteraceae bacterium]